MTDTTEEKVGETFQLYVKNTSNCEGLPLQTFELLGPTWSGDKIELPFGEPPDVKRCDVVGWTDLFMGQPCPVSVAGVSWLPSNVPAITGGPAAPTLGLLVWGGNSGVRILDDQAEPTPGIDDHLPRGFGRPIIWIEDPADLPEEVRRVVMTPDLGYTGADSPKRGNTYVCDLCGFQADQREAIHDHLKTAHQVTDPGEVGSLQQDGRNLTLKNGDDVTVIPLDTWLPTPGVVFINVWNCRAVVARYESAEGGVTWANAKNAEDLEDEAVEAVEAQGGAVNMSGHYACPPELAAKASFDEEKGD